MTVSGLRLYDASGNLFLDTTTLVLRELYVDTVTVGTTEVAVALAPDPAMVILPQEEAFGSNDLYSNDYVSTRYSSGTGELKYSAMTAGNPAIVRALVF